MSKHPPGSKSKHDPEDLPTQLWSPVARSLFAEEFSKKQEAEEQGDAAPVEEDGGTLPDEPEAHDTDPGPPPVEVASNTEPTDDDGPDPLPVWPKKKQKQRKKARRHDPDREATPPAVAVAGEIKARSATPLKPPEEDAQTDPESLRDTLDEPPSEQIMEAARQREAKKAEAKVQAEGAEEVPKSKVITPHSPGSARSDPHATMLVEPARVRFRRLARHECRICGRKVTEPRKSRRFRGAASGRGGFQCERCENTFCAAHVVRTSGFWQSLLFGARFSCLLCQEE